MKKMSLSTKQKINGGLRSVKGKYVLLGLAAMAGAADGGLRYYEAMGSESDPDLAGQDRALLQSEIGDIEQIRDKYSHMYLSKDQAEHDSLGQQIIAAADKAAPDFAFARNLSTRDLAGLAEKMKSAAYGWSSGAMVTGANEDNVAAIHLCQNDILSRPGILRDDVTAREIVQCAVRTHDKTADLALWAVSLTLLGLTAKGLLQGQFRKSIARDEQALHAAAKAALIQASVNDQGNLQASMTLDQDITVRPIKLTMKPIKLAMKPQT